MTIVPSHSKQLATIVTLAVVTYTELITANQVQAFTSPTPVFLGNHARTRSSKLSMAWSLPNTPAFQKNIYLQRNSYWYTNCGTCVDRHVVYNDDDYFDLQDAEAEGLGLGFARLTGYERDLAAGPFSGKRKVRQEGEDEKTAGSLPVRALRGAWNRLLRGKSHH